MSKLSGLKAHSDHSISLSRKSGISGELGTRPIKFEQMIINIRYKTLINLTQSLFSTFLAKEICLCFVAYNQ
jgi:hypothetical protein